MEKSPKSKLGLGIALVLLGMSIAFVKPANNSSSETFASEPIEVQGFDEANESEDHHLPRRIIIPSLDIDLEVKESKIVNGYWEVFQDTAGWGEGSGYPGESGNQVIFAHARENLFLPLREIVKDASVYVLTDDSWYTYTVTDIKDVYPSQIEVISPTEDETLTLYTCTGYQDTKRLIVTAKRIKT